MINLNDLVESLGVTGMLRFLEQFDHEGSGDYTALVYSNITKTSPFIQRQNLI